MLPGYSPILTDFGARKISSIANHQVNIWTGYEWKQNIFRPTGFEKPLYRVTFSNHDIIECTAEQQFILESGEQKSLAKISYFDRLAAFSFPYEDYITGMTITLIEPALVSAWCYELEKPNGSLLVNKILIAH